MTINRLRAALLLFSLLALLACASILIVNPEVIPFSRQRPTSTPTFAISATPSDTPPAPTTTPTRTPVSQAETSATPTITAEDQEASSTPTHTPASQAEPSATPTLTAEEQKASPTPTSSFTLHIVRPGESLCQIALVTYGECVEWVRIWEANDQFSKPHLIHPGQELVVP